MPKAKAVLALKDRPQTHNNAVLRVGDGRGFVVQRRGHLGHPERIVITAAHCLEHARLANGTKGLPPCHPGRYLQEETYPNLLGPLGGKRTVWAQCMFADPVADIAVLGQPDNQALDKRADAYDALVDAMTVLSIADAFREQIKTEKIKTAWSNKIGKLCVKHPVPGRGRARVLSLKGQWQEIPLWRRGGWVGTDQAIQGGMSGSPIINANCDAIAVISTEAACPVIVDKLPAQLLREILAAGADAAQLKRLKLSPRFEDVTSKSAGTTVADIASAPPSSGKPR